MFETSVNRSSSHNTLSFKDFSFKETRLESISFRLYTRVCLSCVKFWQGRRKCLADLVSLPQSQMWILKILTEHRWLKPLKWRNAWRWLEPIRNHAKYFKLTKLQTLKLPLREGLINFKIRFLNIGYQGESWMFGSNLFCSITVEGKYIFWKKLWLTFIKEQFLEFRVYYVVDWASNFEFLCVVACLIQTILSSFK